VASTFNARNAAVYERSMGRWSRQLAPQFLRFAGMGDTVLDVGCGTGSLLLELAGRPEPRRIVGIDASPIYAAAAGKRLGDPRVTVLAADACALPFPDASFDAALSQLVLQVVPDPAGALAEMRRVVRPGGHLLFVNHFAAERGPRWWVERALAPASRKLGWHPDFARDALLAPDDQARAQFASVPPLGLFTLVSLPN
jgi:phosphatidylethanolamine/phosphatidyl-N-methylethanolamine N-methyltransferase